MVLRPFRLFLKLILRMGPAANIGNNVSDAAVKCPKQTQKLSYNKQDDTKNAKVQMTEHTNQPAQHTAGCHLSARSPKLSHRTETPCALRA